MKKLAVIPARSGSKGLPDKNILPLAGKPMMAYTIEAALQSEVFDYVMVSTDSRRYAMIAEQYGAQVPFLRSAENASDTASSWSAVLEVLERLEKEGLFFDIVSLLQPTSPLRTSQDIRGAWRLFEERKANTVVSICELSHPVEWTFPLAEDGAMDAFSQSPYRNMRRQECGRRYMENGAVYITKKEVLTQDTIDIYANRCYGFIMDKVKSYDIDDETDMLLAEAVMQRRHDGNVKA